MKILIVGGGGREHALAWKITRDRPDVELLLAPGNDGSGQLGRRVAIKAEDVSGLLKLASDEGIDLTIVGPEGPLAAGIADAFTSAGLRLFGPSAAAAEIEASKAWAKAFMQRHGIPTARHASCSSLEEVETALADFQAPPVIKDDALAGGKGVTVTEGLDEALAAAEAIFLARTDARVVVEERLDGYEVSAMAFCDGRHAKLLPPACDYKRLRDADSGPNTGGMGAYAPAAISEALRQRIVREVVEPAIRGLAEEDRPFVGVLYPGLMITPEGPKVLEFNCRFGDPEAEVLLPLLETDLVDIALACTEGRLAAQEVRWFGQSCCGIVLASAGYPDKPQTTELTGWENLPNAVAFRGGVSGRVLTVSATGRDLAQAREYAYDAIEQVRVPGGHYRRDIGAFDRALRS